MKRIFMKPWFIGGALLSIAVGSYVVFSGSPEPSYDTVTVTRSTLHEIVSVTGTIVPHDEVNLAFERSGRVTEVNRKVGDHVTAGKTLVTLARGDLQARLLQAEANLDAENAKLLELKQGTRPEDIAVTREKIKRTQASVEDVKQTLRDSHKITDPDKDDFFVQTQADLAARLGSITSILTAFLASVAAISLLVGGIGIMNIMLVSVTERTKEIGLRKALGARDRDILLQFLLEAIMLTVVGGVIGITLGALLTLMATFALNQFPALGWTFVFPVNAAILGIAVAGGVGMIFGLYPARKASQKSPVEALRYE